VSVEFPGTERLTAERLTLAHLPEYRRLLQDPLVTATLTPDGAPLSDETAAEWLGHSVAHWERHGFGYWLLRTKSNGAFVGRAGLRTTSIADQEDDVELGYALLP
jgi:RimJ/RimL family protein N-acetyltransferase